MGTTNKLLGLVRGAHRSTTCCHDLHCVLEGWIAELRIMQPCLHMEKIRMCFSEEQLTQD